jgi:large subunit ribosomal protein L7/L12
LFSKECTIIHFLREGSFFLCHEHAEEQTIFNVVIANAGANKLGVIKTLRELAPTLGLKEAKDLVDAAPKEVLMQVNKKTADEAKEKLTAAGATVELK